MSKKIIISVIAILLLTLVGYFAYNYYMSNQNQNTENKMELGALDPNLKELKVLKVKEGNGRTVQKGDIAYVIYAGFLPDGTVFDSNAQSGQAIGFPIGEGYVIKGWDEGLVGLKEGTEVILDIPADKAYGEKGVKKPGSEEYAIPPNSPLRFDVILVKVLTKEEAEQMAKEQEKNEQDNANASNTDK